MAKGSLCTIVLTLSAAACASRTAAYTSPTEPIIQYIVMEKSCPPAKPAAKIEEKKKETDPVTPEYRALLDTIAWAEGTDHNYNMMIGRMLFADYSSHPIETGEMPQKGIPFKTREGKYWRIMYSSAAGRYQFLYRTYKSLKDEGFFQTGFSPEEQDRAAIYLIQTDGVTQELLDEAIKEKNSVQQQQEFIEIWHDLSGTWASLPHKETKRSRYQSQFANKAEDLQKVFFIYYGQHQR